MALPTKLPKDIQAEIDAALRPIVDGLRSPSRKPRVLAVKTYYLSTSDGVSLDVGVHCIASNEAQLAALATVVREEAQLGDLPHTEHFPTSFVRNQPARH